MRYIEKSVEPPEAIRTFVAAQMAMEEPVNLDYEEGFGRKRQLLAELIAEQFGLCGYTGLPVDDRLEDYNTDELRRRGIQYRAHNEHIKAQSVCKTEALAAGRNWGCEVCEDMDHNNIIAAVEVRGAAEERFGAVVRGNSSIPLPPTDPRSEVEFRYSIDGTVVGTTPESNSTKDLLLLEHRTLHGYRKSWVSAFLSLETWASADDLNHIIRTIETPIDGRLTKFSFCIASAARQILTAISNGAEP